MIYGRMAREKSILIRLSDAEHWAIVVASRGSSLPPSTFVRKVVLDFIAAQQKPKEKP